MKAYRNSDLVGWTPKRIALNKCRNGAIVSTVDLRPISPPETCVFDGAGSDVVERYDNIGMAIFSHDRHVAAQGGLAPSEKFRMALCAILGIAQ